MRERWSILCYCLLLIVLAASCRNDPQLSETNTKCPPVVSTHTPIWEGPCDLSTDEIEINSRAKTGLGVGYTPPDKPCSVYCLHVPKGNQLLIGVADLEHQLSFYVLDILFDNWDPGLPPNIGMLAGTNRIIVAPRTMLTHPSGRYYIYVCPGGNPGEYWDYGSDGDSIIFTGTSFFTLYNEFTP